MATDSLNTFLKALGVLLPADRQQQVASLADSISDPKALARELVKRGWLTLFQANKALQGRAASLVLGPYVLLDLLGEGGMGQVFKARHTVMNRLVALKVVRGERLGDPGAVARFRREIEMVARLTHPNIVRAYDAAEAGKNHYFVMEYVEGADLARLVKDRGPLAIAEACDYIRQAALGLQHAHEHGMVHRDIKPGNLLVANNPAGQVKILDLGLARIQREQTTTDLTPEGAVMGTPDYLAPEQGTDAGKVDIRADIYSLGCTLYHLLTGRVPFPGGSLVQKLHWHQQAEPAALESVRQDVPETLGAIVRKMMAKKPADRYPTPAAVAAALAPFCPGASAIDGPAALPSTRTHVPDTVATASPPRRSWLIPVAVAGLVLLVGLGGLIFWLTRSRGRDSTPGEQPGVEVAVRLIGIARPADARVLILIDGRPIPFDELQKDVKLTMGRHTVEVRKDDKVIESREFVVSQEDDGQQVVVPEANRPAGLITSLSGHQKEVTSVSFSGDGLRLLSVGPNAQDGVFVWDVASGKELFHYRSGRAPKPKLIRGYPHSGALSPEGHSALIGTRHSYAGQRAVPWVFHIGLESGNKFWESDDPKRVVLTVAYSRDGKLVLASDEAGFTRVWDKNGRKLYQFDGSLAAFSPTADRVVTAQQKRAKLYRLGEPIQELQTFSSHDDVIRSVAFAPDGRRVLTGGDTTLRLWDVGTGKQIHIFRGHKKEVTSVAISPDGQRVLSGSRDGTVRLWDIASEKELLNFTQHTDEVNSVAYSPGGRRAASGGRDATVRLWALPR